MSKERLETIKELVKKIESILYDEWRQQELIFLIESLYYIGHVDWLIQQAERVHELESDSYNAHLERLLDRKEQEIERYREVLEYIQREIRKAIYTPKNNKCNSDFEREFEKGKTRGLIQASDIVKKALEGTK